ncbi:hypothetical protein P8C59_000050 [Phyllachora maydis]|uniref:Uncharacterized protein n=1 Tax=Phyllachora maydis TaxID=1825666 RepID=A0AAD9HW68_9PEZI|nr:hypothetical protein P8C59_000050 [Phyllachora maydis]
MPGLHTSIPFLGIQVENRKLSNKQRSHRDCRHHTDEANRPDQGFWQKVLYQDCLYTLGRLRTLCIGGISY